MNRSGWPLRPRFRSVQWSKFASAFLLGWIVAFSAGCGDEGSPVEPIVTEDPASWVLRWNQIAIDASGIDHKGPSGDNPNGYFEHMGPGRASRAMAITHIAMFEAVNAMANGGYESYVGLEPASGAPLPARGNALKAAIAVATHDALAALYTRQRAALDDYLEEDLASIPEGEAKEIGVNVGHAAALAILERRAGDGSAHPEPQMGVDYIPSDLPGEWRVDPIGLQPMALGAKWGQVALFLDADVTEFRAPPPPALNSPEYTAAFNEVKAFGGDENTPNVRTEDETFVGIFWAYDGLPSLCAPPRLFNQIVRTITAKQGPSDVVELARLFALTNIALADATTAVWESKYFYKFWRPVCGIREADEGTGPMGLGDGNPATVGDPNWTPLGAPASNTGGPNFTPPFPSYPSGHGGMGGALFQLLREYYGTDAIAFDLVSDEFNGVTRDNQGNVRPHVVRHFHSFSEAEEENGQSRIYLGIHWSFDKTAAIAQGRTVGSRVLSSIYQRKQRPA